MSVPEGVDYLPGAAFGVGGNIATRFEVGFPIGYFFGYETNGIFQTQAEIDDSDVEQAGAQVGDLRFVDQNGDGVINFNDDSDKKMLGSPIPKFTMGSIIGFRFHGLDFSTNLYAAIGQKIIRNFERQHRTWRLRTRRRFQTNFGNYAFASKRKKGIVGKRT